MRFIDREEVARRLTYEAAIPIVREAMIAFSTGRTRQLLRSILPLAEGRMFGVMPGALGEHAPGHCTGRRRQFGAMDLQPDLPLALDGADVARLGQLHGP